MTKLQPQPQPENASGSGFSLQPGSRKTAASGVMSRRAKWLTVCGLIILTGAAGMLWQRRSAPAEVRPPDVDLSTAADAVREAISAAQDDVLRELTSARCWGQLGVVLLAHEFDPDAVICLRQAVQLAADDFRWNYYLGLAATALNRAEAVTAFERACRLRPSDPLAHARLGELLLAQGDLTEAETHLRTAVNNSMSAVRPLQALARVRLMQGDAVEAKTLAEQALAMAPDSRMVLQVLAQALDHTGDKSAATEILHHSQSLPDQPLPWDDPYAAQALSRRTGEADIRDQVAAMADAGKVEAAIARLQTELGRHPGNLSLTLLLADLCARIDRTETSLSLLEKLREHNPAKAEIPFRIGVIRFLREEWSLAGEAFQQALDISPEYALAQYNLGQCFLREGDHLRAIDAFTGALRNAPENDAARINLARLLIENNQAAEAKQHLQHVLHRIPDNSEVKALMQQIP